MTHFKKSACGVIAILMVLGLTACMPEEPKTETVSPTPNIQQTLAPAETEQTPADNDPANSPSVNTPSVHISKIFSESFMVEADVHAPDIQSADVLFARYVPFDEQELLSVFFNGKTPKREPYPADNAITYNDADSYLYMADGRILYRTQDFGYVKFPTENFAPASDIASTNKRFGEVFTQDNLPFTERMEAFETAADILRQLTIGVSENAEMYAIDFHALQIQQDERIQNDIDHQKQMGFSPILDPTDGYDIKNTFTEEDDFYIIYFTMTQGGIPVTKQSYGTMGGERTMYGSTARASFSKNGIIELDCTGLLRKESVAESQNTLITAEQALQNAYEIHNSVISADIISVTAIDLEYVPVPYNGNYNEVKLVPAWSLTMTCEREVPSKGGKEETETSVTHKVVFINAITGEEIK